MSDELMTPGEVAEAFSVDPKTVARWAKAGKLRSVRTLGGHRRYKRDDIMLLLRQDGAAPPATRTTFGKPWWDEDD